MLLVLPILFGLGVQILAAFVILRLILVNRLQAWSFALIFTVTYGLFLPMLIGLVAWMSSPSEVDTTTEFLSVSMLVIVLNSLIAYPLGFFGYKYVLKSRLERIAAKMSAQDKEQSSS
jgi:hypothetical protein